MSFNRVLWFSMEKYFTPLVKSTPKNFIVCSATINGIVLIFRLFIDNV